MNLISLIIISAIQVTFFILDKLQQVIFFSENFISFILNVKLCVCNCIILLIFVGSLLTSLLSFQILANFLSLAPNLGYKSKIKSRELTTMSFFTSQSPQLVCLLLSTFPCLLTFIFIINVQEFQVILAEGIGKSTFIPSLSFQKWKSTLVVLSKGAIMSALCFRNVTLVTATNWLEESKNQGQKTRQNAPAGLNEEGQQGSKLGIWRQGKSLLLSYQSYFSSVLQKHTVLSYPILWFPLPLGSSPGMWILYKVPR